MKNRLWLVLLALVLVSSLLIPACAKPAPPPAPAPKPAPAPAPAPAPKPAPPPAPAPAPLPRVLNVGTSPIGSWYNLVASTVGAMVSRHTPIDAKVKPMGGPGAWLPMMVRKEIDVGIISNWHGWKAYLGEDKYEKPTEGKGFPIRLVLTGTTIDASFVVRADSPYKTIADLKGARVAGVFHVSRCCYFETLGYLANHGLTYDDVKVVPVASPPPGVRGIIEGKIDAANATTGMPIVAELDAKWGARFLSLDPSPAAWARFIEQYPTAVLKSYPKDAYRGCVEDETWFQRSEAYIVCRADLADSAVDAIIRAMWDFNYELPSIHRKHREWQPETFASKMLYVPYHPGAIKFLKEKGLWTPELEKSQQELLAQKK